MKKIQKTLILILAVIAAAVAIILAAKRSAWILIVAYWCVLTLKNYVDYIEIGGKRSE